MIRTSADMIIAFYFALINFGIQSCKMKGGGGDVYRHE